MQISMPHTSLPGSCRLPARTPVLVSTRPQQLQLATGRDCCSCARLVATLHVQHMPVCGQRRPARPASPALLLRQSDMPTT